MRTEDIQLNVGDVVQTSATRKGEVVGLIINKDAVKVLVVWSAPADFEDPKSRIEMKFQTCDLHEVLVIERTVRTRPV